MSAHLSIGDRERRSVAKLWYDSKPLFERGLGIASLNQWLVPDRSLDLVRTAITVAATSTVAAATRTAAIAAVTPSVATASAAAISTSIAATVTASITAAPAATAATTTKTTAAGPLFAGPGLVDRQGSCAVLLAVETSDGVIGFIIVGHFDEAEAAAASTELVNNHLAAGDGAIWFEKSDQIVAGRLVGKIPDINVLRHDPPCLVTETILRPRPRFRLSGVVEARAAGCPMAVDSTARSLALNTMIVDVFSDKRNLSKKTPLRGESRARRC